MKTVLAAALSLVFTAVAVAAPDPLTRPINPDYAKQWLDPQTPIRLHGDSYFVGFKGLSLVLIKTSAGLILIDGGVPQSVAAVEANIRSLGFRIEDVRYILNTESHWDHSSGIAALARDSGATALTSPSGARALRAGRSDPDDPQSKDLETFPAAAKVGELRDGQALKLGGVTVTAHATPGHTPGSTSYSWRDCQAGKCADLVFSASLNPISSDGFHFTADKTHGDLTPGFKAGLRRLAALPCDILISAHPNQSGLDARMAKAEAQKSAAPFNDPNACRAYVSKYEALLDARIAKEKAGR